MNPNEKRTFWISVGLALLSVLMLYSYTQEKSDELTKNFGQKDNVIIAKRDIREMETIDEEMLDIVQIPNNYKQPTAITSKDIAVGRIALAPIKTGEQILVNKIIEPGPVTGLSLQVAPSKRAVAIPVDDIRGVAKLVKPGDRIDLIASLDVGKGAQQRREVKTLMQDVVVLATGLQITNEVPALLQKQGKDDFIKNLRGDVAFSTITIEATPKEAQDLIFILSTSPGSLYMTLRHPSDHTKLIQPASTIDSVLGRVDTPMMMESMRSPATPPMPTLPQAPMKPQQPKKRGPFINM